jgi:starvation-inducible outer membrane lipoprotein
MKHALVLALAALLAACATLPPPVPAEPSPCAKNEASYDCQVERYRNVQGD